MSNLVSYGGSEEKKLWEKDGEKATLAERDAPMTEARMKHLKNRPLKIIANTASKYYRKAPHYLL